MSESVCSNSEIQQYLAAPLEIGEPDTVGPLAVFPVFGPKPQQAYHSFSHARGQGFQVKELERSASVGDLVVDNPLDDPVLLYEGEEVLSAQQHRTFDVTVLAPPHKQLRVPVSCVEVGRWDGSRHSEVFDKAPETAYPELRRAKSRQVRARVAAGMDARADQTAVWNNIAEKSARHCARSTTGAMHDVFESRRGALLTITGGVMRRADQLGALVAIDGKFTVLDWVSRPEVFEALHGPLLQGYALDALEAWDLEAPSMPAVEEAEGFVSLVCGTFPQERGSIGLGRDLRFAADSVAGSGLVAGDELIQITAFPEDTSDQTDPSARSGRIRRPSRRRS